MLLKELLDIKAPNTIPEIDTQRLIKNLNDNTKNLIGKCSPREHVCTVYVSENQFNTDEKKAKMEIMIGDFNKAITQALFQEISNQIKNGTDVEAKNFIMKAENPDDLSKKISSKYKK